MKKIILIIIIFFLFPLNISGEEKTSDIYLDNLEIIGYEMTPKFDKYNNLYTLITSDNIEKIDFNLLLEDGSDSYEVLGNDNLVIGKNEVTIKVFNEEKKLENIYQVVVTKTEEQKAMLNFDEVTKLEIKKEELNKTDALLLGGGVVIILFILFYLFFFTKKSCRKK